jgi:hypothetical protein
VIQFKHIQVHTYISNDNIWKKHQAMSNPKVSKCSNLQYEDSWRCTRVVRTRKKKIRPKISQKLHWSRETATGIATSVATSTATGAAISVANGTTTSTSGSSISSSMKPAMPRWPTFSKNQLQLSL